MIPLRVLLLRRHLPAVTLLLIAMNTLCFLYEMGLPMYARDRFIEHFGLIPDRLAPLTFLSSMFLHGGWLHLIGNMWFLWVFGSHIEDAMGGGRFLVFYLLSGIASAIVQFTVLLGTAIPTIGASGAIAGVMGAFLVFYPRVRVVTLIFIMTIDIPAAFMLLYWFVLQLISGVGYLSMVSQGQSIAWFAHVGGFLAGIVLIRIFGQQRARLIY